MRTLLAAVAAIGLLTTGAHAGFDDPKALVQSLFEPYQRGEQPGRLDTYYADGLKRLFVQYNEQPTSIMGTRKVAATVTEDFDPFVDARHYLLFDLNIADPVVNGDRAMVAVSYKNFDHPTELAVSLRKQADGWKIDDVASLGADDHWLLSWVLMYDPTGVH